MSRVWPAWIGGAGHHAVMRARTAAANTPTNGSWRTGDRAAPKRRAQVPPPGSVANTRRSAPCAVGLPSRSCGTEVGLAPPLAGEPCATWRGAASGGVGESKTASFPPQTRPEPVQKRSQGTRRMSILTSIPRVPQDPGLLLYAPESGSARLVVGQEGAWQCDGARAGQVGRGIHRGVARGRDAEHRGERGARRGAGGDGPRRHAGLGDRAAGRAAEAAHVGTSTLARAESAGRNAGARGAGGERRESDANRAGVPAVTAALVCPAGAVTGNADAGRDAVRIGRARGRRIVAAVAGRDAGAGSPSGRAVRSGRARGHPVTGAAGCTTGLPVSGLLSGWALRGKGADAARRAVPRDARRAGGGAGHPRARAAVAGSRPGAARRAGGGAPRARLGQVAGDVDVGGQRNGRRRRAAGEVER